MKPIAAGKSQALPQHELLPIRVAEIDEVRIVLGLGGKLVELGVVLRI